MSVNNQYCSDYRKKVQIDCWLFWTRSWRVLGTILIKRASWSILTISISRFDFYIGVCYVQPESEQGQLVLSVLKSNNLLFDDRYVDFVRRCELQLSTPLSTNPDLKLCCCACSAQPYTQWKLIGVTCDSGSEVVKCTLPYVLCEGCYRKRFCDQKQTRYLCNIAVFPLMDPPKRKLVPPSSNSTTIVMVGPIPPSILPPEQPLVSQ